MPERPRSGTEHLDTGGEHRDRHERAGTDHDHPPRELVLLDAREVQGDAATRDRRLESPLVRLDPANAGTQTGGQDLDLIPCGERAFDERSGDHRAEARQREGPVDREARPTEVATRGRGPENGCERGDEVREPGLRGGRDVDHRRTGERRAAQRRGDVGPRERCPFLVDQIAFGQGDDASIDAEHAEDRKMLSRLRHHAFIERDHEQDRVDRTDARQHVPDEVLMAGHVNDADLSAVGQNEPREPEVDGHAPLVLLAEAVGVDAG